MFHLMQKNFLNILLKVTEKPDSLSANKVVKSHFKNHSDMKWNLENGNKCAAFLFVNKVVTFPITILI